MTDHGAETTDAAAVDRTVTPAERDGQEVRVILARRRYGSAIHDVWNALTDPERLPRWFLPVSGDLSVGGRYQFEGNAGGEVLACDPPTRALVTWVMGETISWLELRLTATGPDETTLELEHVAPVDPEFWTTYGPGAVGVGWDLALMGLAQHLTSGQNLDPVAAQAWVATAEGLAFVRGSSDGWATASVAGGTDADEAARAGERTYAFYTGS